MSTSTTSSTITRPNPRADEDPIHSWMRVVPKPIPESKRPGDITEELRERGFDPSQSRAIIFTVSRNDTEDLARELNHEATSQDSWKGRVRWYHAGMTADERSATYEGFRSGDTAILCATKAFGMGMDIPNIHYVFHLQPPYSLEDYIQQIGRAGRDESVREEAGFGKERPIRCVLYAETEDFETLHGRLKASRLSWGQVSRIQDVLHEYAARLDHHEPDPDSAIPVPTDLVARHEAFEDVYDASTMQKTGFHWLERLERIRQEYYVPAHLELANRDPETDRATTEEMQALCQHVETVRRDTAGDKERILVNTGHLFNLFDINTSAALFEHLRTAQEAGHVRVFRTLSVQCTKKHANVIRKATEEKGRLPPRLALAFQLAQSIVAGLSHDRFFQLDSEWFTSEARTSGREVLSPSEWEWLDDEESREEDRSDVVSDLQQGSRARAILFLVRRGPDVQFRSTLEGDGEVFEMRIKSKEGDRRQQEQYLSRIRDLTKHLLALVYEKNTVDSQIDLMSTLDKLDLEGERDINEFEQTLLFLERIGFLKISGGLLPMAIETYLRSKEPIDASDQESKDFAVREQFQKAGRLKELRLFALRVLASLEEEARQNTFIKQYLQSEGPGEVLSLLDETLDDTEAAPDLLSALREEALQEEVDRLSEEQEAVYASPLNKKDQPLPSGISTTEPFHEKVFSPYKFSNSDGWWAWPDVVDAQTDPYDPVEWAKDPDALKISFNKRVNYFSILSLELYRDAGPGDDPVRIYIYDSKDSLIDKIGNGWPPSGSLGCNGYCYNYFKTEYSYPDIKTVIIGGESEPTTLDRLSFNVAPIPEPSTMLLFSTGLFALAGIGRKKLYKKS